MFIVLNLSKSFWLFKMISFACVLKGLNLQHSWINCSNITLIARNFSLNPLFKKLSNLLFSLQVCCLFFFLVAVPIVPIIGLSNSNPSLRRPNPGKFCSYLTGLNVDKQNRKLNSGPPKGWKTDQTHSMKNIKVFWYL